MNLFCEGMMKVVLESYLNECNRYTRYFEQALMQTSCMNVRTAFERADPPPQKRLLPQPPFHSAAPLTPQSARMFKLSSRRRFLAGTFLGASLAWSASALAQQPETETEQPPVTEIPETVVEASLAAEPFFGPTTALNRGDSLLGSTPSASEGVFGREDLRTRPTFGGVNILDPIPGFASTVHNSGSDAAIYYIRGVPVDHGTDFAIFVDGMPINDPSHAHSQGFADLNFMIPEMVETVRYRKGSYYADLGDFSTAGAANMQTARTLEERIDRLSVGQYGWIRGLTANTVQNRFGDLTYAADLSYFDNAFETPERNKRLKLMSKQTVGDEFEGLSNSLMAYTGEWFSTEEQPLRAIESGLITRLGNLDPSNGGRSGRYSWNTEYWRHDDSGSWNANAYVVYHRFDLFFNSTFFAEDPVNGDQRHQPDGRLKTGFNLSRKLNADLGGKFSPITAGVQVRDDFINRSRTERTSQRNVIAVDGSHRVNIFTVSPYLKTETQWTDWARTDVGVRGDLYQFDVVNLLDPSTTGNGFAGLATPKFSLILGPWDNTEYYFNYGDGFHSNDARGLFDPVNPSQALARTKSTEIGLRSERFEEWTTDITAWYQEFDSELFFDGESGSSEARGASRRYGVEWNNRLQVTQWMTWDIDWAWADVRFIDEPAGPFIPGSLSHIFSTGPTIKLENGMYAQLWFRHFSPRPLLEDNSVRAPSVEVGNLQMGWRRNQWEVAVDVFNVFGSKDYAEAFFFASRLPGEPAPVDDLHVHPVDPTQARLTVTRYY